MAEQKTVKVVFGASETSIEVTDGQDTVADIIKLAKELGAPVAGATVRVNGAEAKATDKVPAGGEVAFSKPSGTKG